MVTWPQALERVATGPTDLDLTRRRRPTFGATPLVIAGSSGAGKTQLWSRLTQNEAEKAMSHETDDGYMIYRNTRPLTLTTVPGQYSRSRDFVLREMFSEDTIVNGVVFIASNGFDHIWSRYTDSVASELSPFNLTALRHRNRAVELDNFREICRHVEYKIDDYTRGAPKWILVAVNKLDLWFDDVATAENYYLPGCGSEFDKISNELIKRKGSDTLRYQVLPLATVAQSYEFNSTRGSLTASSHLSDTQCDSTVRSLVETLGELGNE